MTDFIYPLNDKRAQMDGKISFIELMVDNCARNSDEALIWNGLPDLEIFNLADLFGTLAPRLPL